MTGRLAVALLLASAISTVARGAARRRVMAARRW